MERFKFICKSKIEYGIPKKEGMTVEDAMIIAMDHVKKNAPIGYIFEDDHLTFIGMEIEKPKIENSKNLFDIKCDFCGCVVPTDSCGHPLQYCDC